MTHDAEHIKPKLIKHHPWFSTGAAAIACENNRPVIKIAFLNGWRFADDGVQFYGWTKVNISELLMHDNQKSTVVEKIKCDNFFQELRMTIKWVQMVIKVLIDWIHFLIWLCKQEVTLQGHEIFTNRNNWLFRKLFKYYELWPKTCNFAF